METPWGRFSHSASVALEFFSETSSMDVKIGGVFCAFQSESDAPEERPREFHKVASI